MAADVRIAEMEQQANWGKLRNMTSIFLTCGDLILLLYRQGSRVVNDMWVGSAGGHFEKEELNDAGACVLRELKEELGLDESMLENVALRYVVLRGMQTEIRQNYYFFAELKSGTELALQSKEGILKWFHVDEISDLKMPISAEKMIKHWLKTGRYTDKIYGGIVSGTDVVFTEITED